MNLTRSDLRMFIIYILSGGLIISALIAITGIIIGQFNEIIFKSLVTTFIIVSHSLVALAVISADKNGQLGKSLLPTVILGTTIASLFTYTFGLWELWDPAISSKAFTLYALLIGGSFLIHAALHLNLKHKVTTYAVTATVISMSLFVLSLIPWLVLEAYMLTDIYYRIIGALSVLVGTTLSLSVISNRVAVSSHPELRTPPARPRISSGLVAIYITFGTLTAGVWFVGLIALLLQAN